MDYFFPYLHPQIVKLINPALNALVLFFKMRQIFFHNYQINLKDPIEEEMYLISRAASCSAYWGFIFPQSSGIYFGQYVQLQDRKLLKKWQEEYHFCLKKASLKSQGKQLILKNPVNTARIEPILKLFPNAKFIFIYRNPYHVYFSMERLWRKVLEKYYCLQKITPHQRELIIFSHYNQLMGEYEKSKHLIPAENLVEVKYENLEEKPMSEIKEIYKKLGLPDFEHAANAISSQIEKEKNYRKFDYDYDEKTISNIDQHFGYFIKKWNYSFY